MCPCMRAYMMWYKSDTTTNSLKKNPQPSSLYIWRSKVISSQILEENFKGWKEKRWERR